MSNIVVILKESNIETSVLKDLYKIIGGPLTEIRTAISKGRPIIEMEIFDNQYEEKSKLLRKLISLIRSSGLEVDIFEIPEGDSFEASKARSESKISEDILENILDYSDDEIDCQLDI